MTAMTPGAPGTNGRWFSVRARRRTARVQLFCLPYAGAGASVFRDWPAAFSPRVEVIGVQLPGRESRFAEPAVLDPGGLAVAIAAEADRPYALFGHSMGGRLAFDVVRELRRSGDRMPVRLCVSGSPPPDVRTGGPFDGLSKVGDDELIARLAAGGGIPAEVLAEPDLLRLLTPLFRADLGWVDDYTYVSEPPLPVPLTVFAGVDDEIVPLEFMSGWRRQTTAGCAVHVLPGGHFFLHEQLQSMADVIETDLVGGGPC